MRYIVLFAALIAAPLAAQNQTRVKTYIKRDGTVVISHSRTTPNGTTADNWSTKPNVNPWTGKAGTQAPTLPPPPKPKKNPYGSGR